MQAFLMVFQDLNEANVRLQQTSNFRNYFPQNVLASWWTIFFRTIFEKTALVNCQNSKQFDKMAPEHAHPKVYLFGKELYDKKYCLTELLVFK